MRKSLWSARLVTAALVVVAVSGHAQAQSLYERSTNIPVTSRPHPEYDAIGVRLGAFRAYPRLSLAGTYDDNVYALSNKTSGLIASVIPSVDIVSGWSRHALNVNLRYEHDRYLDQPDQSSNSYGMSSTGRFDIDRVSALNFSFGAARLVQPRTSPDSFAGLREPVQYDLVNARASIYREFNKLRLDASASTAVYSFFNTPLLNGGVLDSSSRDEISISQTLRGSWAFSPDLAVFGQISPNQSHFFQAPRNGFSSFDSSGYAMTIGVNGQVTNLITADAGIGFYSQGFDDPRIPGRTGLAYNATVRYFPTQLLTVTGRASQSFAAAGIPGTPASDVNSFDVQADYELRRFFIVTPQASFVRYAYPGTTRIDNRFGFGVSGTYLVNRSMGVTGSYSHIRQDSNGSFGGISFNDNRFTLTLTLQR